MSGSEVAVVVDEPREPPTLIYLEEAEPPTPIKRPLKSVPRTPEGDDTGTIMGDWIAWVEKGTGIRPPQIYIDRLGKEVKNLVSAQYHTGPIKMCMAYWLDEWFRDDKTSPRELSRIAWKYVIDNSAHAQKFKTELRARVSQMQPTPVTPQTQRSEDRRNAAARAAEQWLSETEDEIT